MNSQETIEAYLEWDEQQEGIVTNLKAFQAGAAYAATLRQQAARVDEDLSKWANGTPMWSYIHTPAAGQELVLRAEAEARIKEAALSAQPAERQGEATRPMGTAPRDGTMLRLLVRFTEHATEDAEEAWTIGSNSFDANGEDVWQFAGWCWTHDHFTEGKGTPIGWLPMHDTHPAAPVGVPDGEVRLWDSQWANIVNHDNCYRGWDKADAINHAVKMTEQAIARNVADGKLPPPRIAAAPSAPQGVE